MASGKDPGYKDLGSRAGSHHPLLVGPWLHSPTSQTFSLSICQRRRGETWRRAWPRKSEFWGSDPTSVIHGSAQGYAPSPSEHAPTKNVMTVSCSS